MFQFFFIFIVILALVSFQISFLPYFFSPENIPDFLLVLIIFSAIQMKFSKILAWVVLVGIIFDMSYFAPLGLNVFIFVLIAFVASFLFERILVTHGAWKCLTICGLLIIGTLFNDWILAIAEKLIFKNNLHYSWNLFLGKDIFIKILFNLIISGLIYWPLLKIYKYFELYYSRTKVLK